MRVCLTVPIEFEQPCHAQQCENKGLNREHTDTHERRRLLQSLADLKKDKCDYNEDGHNGFDEDKVEAAEKGEGPFSVGTIVTSASRNDIKELWDNRNKKKCGVYSQSGAFMSDVVRKIVECKGEAATASQYRSDFNLAI
jgi:hypothetical protein